MAKGDTVSTIGEEKRQSAAAGALGGQYIE
jgi:hypothetical protein